MPSRLNDEVDLATLGFTQTDVLAGRQTAGAGPAEEIVCTAAGRAVLAAATAALQRVAIDAQQADADLAAIAALATTIYGRALLTMADAAAARAAIGGNAVGTRTVSGAAPSGGNDGDIWLQV